MAADTKLSALHNPSINLEFYIVDEMLILFCILFVIHFF